MVLILKEREMRAFAMYLDMIQSAANQITVEIDPEIKPTAPNSAKELEDYLNKLIGCDQKLGKIVTVKFTFITRNCIITVNPEFITDVMNLYCEAINFVVPPMVVCIKTVMGMQQKFEEDFVPKAKSFDAKWRVEKDAEE